MGGYVIRRLLQLVLVLFGISVILFVALFLVPGDQFTSAGDPPRALDQRVEEELTRRYGLNQPLPVRYASYVGHLLRGDLGTSYVSDRPVSEELRQGILATAELALAAILVMSFIGGAAGVISALSRYSFWDVLITLTTTLAIGVPTFVVGLLLQQTFARGGLLEWFPRSGQHGLRSLVLPALTLAAVDAALVARLMRGSILETLRADFVRTARAKGLPEAVVTVRHVVRASMIPVITYLGVAFGSLLGGALITENIFDWKGIGFALRDAIQHRDTPVVMAIVTYGAAIFVLVNLLVDIAYAWLDPRIRLEEST